MKKLLSILFALACLTAPAQLKISSYPNTNQIDQAWLFLLANPGVTNWNITMAQLGAFLSTNVVAAQATHATNADNASGGTVTNGLQGALGFQPATNTASSVIWNNDGTFTTNNFSKGNFSITAAGAVTMAGLSASSANLGSGSLATGGSIGGSGASLTSDGSNFTKTPTNTATAGDFIIATGISGGNIVTATQFGKNGNSLTNLAAAGLPYRAGKTNIGNLATTLLITFTSALSDTNYAVAIGFDSTLGAAVGTAATSKTTSSFILNLSGGIAGGANLDYMVWPYR